MAVPPSQGDFDTQYYKDQDIILNSHFNPVSVSKVRDQQIQDYIPDNPSLMQEGADVLSSIRPGETLKYPSYRPSVEESLSEPSFASNTNDAVLCPLCPGTAAITPVQQASIRWPISNDLCQAHLVPVVDINNFQWNKTNASVSDEHSNHFFNTFFPPTTIQKETRHPETKSNSSPQSWDQLNIHNLTPSQSSTEGFEIVPRDEVESSMPTGIPDSSQTEYFEETAQISTESSQPLKILTKSFAPSSAKPSRKGNRGASFGPIHTGVVMQKKRGKLTTVGREKAKKVRRIGACIRCRMMGVGCDEGNPCTRCLNILGKARTFLELCWRDDLGNICLVRQGNSEFGQEVMQFRNYHWKAVANDIRVLSLSWTFPGGRSSELPTLAIDCQEFVPRHDDVIAVKFHHDGVARTIELPTFAVYDTATLRTNVSKFLDTGRARIQADLVDQVTNELERRTLTEAYRFASKYNSGIVTLALRLLVNTRLSAGWGTPEGDETLGIEKVANADSGYVGEKPLPPAIDHQIDVAIWENLHNDHQALIKQLKAKLFCKGRKPWLEIFLTFFVALVNMQFVHGQALGWMNSQQHTDSAVRVNHLVYEMIKRWDYSADNLLHHFRSIFRGELPLAMADKNFEELIEREKLDSESVKYIAHVLRLLKDQGI